MKALLVINARSGTVERAGVDAIKKVVARVFEERADASLVMKVSQCEELVDAVNKAKNDFDAVICAGGDGTQAAIAGVLLNTQTALLPLPCGTVNELCRDLGIPLKIEEALRHALDGPTAKIDVGSIGGRVFLNNIVFGAYAELAEAREELREATTLDDLSFSLVEAADALVHAAPIRFRITMDGDAAVLKTNTVVVSNNAISSAENLIPHRDRLDEGRLYVYLVEARDGRDFAALLAAFARGEAKDSERIKVRTCKRCRISSSEETFSYTIDGDPVETEEPVDIAIAPAALKVFAPGAAE